MEFMFDINVLFAQDITRTFGSSSLVRRQSSNKWDNGEKNVATVIDALGAASAKAQGLNSVITTAQKFISSNQVLYIMKDGDCNNGKGAAVGMIKVGLKVLFLADRTGVLHEVEPLCVLDFYVHESRQRTGCGKKLFEAMLEAEQKKAFEIAIDRPSPKFISFLKKHYNLQSHVKQANNFVVFDQFFTTCVDRDPASRRRSLQKGTVVEPLAPSQLTDVRTGVAGGPVVLRVPAGVGGPLVHLHSHRPTQHMPLPAPQQTAPHPLTLENTSSTFAHTLGSATAPQQGACQLDSSPYKDSSPSGPLVSSIIAPDHLGGLDHLKAPYLNMRNPVGRRRGQGTGGVDWLNHSTLYGTGVPAVAKTTNYSRHQSYEPSPLKLGGTLPPASVAPGFPAQQQNSEVPRGSQRTTWRSYIA
ncbi:hypothetical protein EMCRGX_G021010 [Ephydatia muelleri]